MSKVILEFTKGHGPYVKGDIAGFDPEKAARLKSVTKPYDASKSKTSVDVKISIDSAEAAKFVKETEARFKAEADKLDARAKALDDREKELAKLAEAAQAKTASEGGSEPATKEPEKATKGEPPAQGSAKAKTGK